MSNYSTFKPQPDFSVGDIILDTKEPYGNSWTICNGTVFEQTTYPELFYRLGTIQNISTFPNSYSLVNSGTSSAINALAYNNGVYVYGGAGGVLATSVNGITWTARTSGTTTDIEDLVYGNDKFVFVGANRTARYSTDGITWTSVSLPSSGGSPAWASGTDPTKLIYGNGIFLVGASTGQIATSTDGITWTARTSGTTSTIRSLTYGNGIYVYGVSGGGLATSTDGITWTARTSGTTSNIDALTYGNGKYVFGAGRTLGTSTDSITWTTTTLLSSGKAFSELYYESSCNVFLYSTETGDVGKSNDAITWSSITSNTSNNIQNFENNIFVASGGTVGFANVYTYNVSTQFAIPNVSNLSILDISSNAYIKFI